MRLSSSSFRWLWLGQLISNLGTQCSLYGLGLWAFSQDGQLLSFAAVAFVVQLSKILVLPLLGRKLVQWPRRRVFLVANSIGALCTLSLSVQLLLWGHREFFVLLTPLIISSMAEAALMLSTASMIPLLVPKPGELARANGLFSGTDGVVSSAAPFAGSWLVAFAGLQGVLLVDGISFVLALMCVLRAWTPQLDQRFKFAQRVTQPWHLRLLFSSAAIRPVAIIGSVMALIYAGTEVMFPAWMLAGPGTSRLGTAMLLGASGYLAGFFLWQRWGWRRPSALLVLGLIIQSLILMGAGLNVFERWIIVWCCGLLAFTMMLPMVLAALQTRWQSLAPVEELPELLAQRYRLEWGARLIAFALSAPLVDGFLGPALHWSFLPGWLTDSLGDGPGRPMAVGLGALGWVLILVLVSQMKDWIKGSRSPSAVSG